MSERGSFCVAARENEWHIRVYFILWYDLLTLAIYSSSELRGSRYFEGLDKG